jgi:aerotolerance regulator-like protein
MIGWLTPAAFYGLLLAAVPLIVHLLRTRRAERVTFPTVRFLEPSISAAVRLRTPADWILLALRTAIVVSAVGALAQPIWLSSSRLALWNERTSRAVVVDVSESMQRSGPDGRRAADAAEEAASAELRSAAYSRRFDSHDPGRDIVRASAWLRDAPPARREVVIITDAQRGTIDASDLTAVPVDVGIRFVAVGAPEQSRAVDVFNRFGGAGIPARAQQVVLNGDETRLILSAPGVEHTDGLRVLASAREAQDVAGLLRAVAAAGAPSPSAEQRLLIGFPAADQPESVGRITEPWMLRTLLRLQQDDQVARIARHAGKSAWPRQGARFDGSTWAIVARDEAAVPIVGAGAAGREMIVDVGAPVSSLLAVAVVRAALAARLGPPGLPEAEIDRISRDALVAWSRRPGPVERDAWRLAETSDARWLWLAVIALLRVEGWLRTRPVAQGKKEEPRAAA